MRPTACDEFIFEASAKDGVEVPAEFDSNRDNVLTAVTQKGTLLNYADESLKRDKDVVLAAVTNDGYSLEFADASLKRDKDVVFADASYEAALQRMEASVKSAVDAMLAAMTQEGLEYAVPDRDFQDAPDEREDGERSSQTRPLRNVQSDGPIQRLIRRLVAPFLVFFLFQLFGQLFTVLLKFFAVYVIWMYYI